MDATASIINIIQLTGTLVDFLRAAKNAAADRRTLLLEANTLVALLTSLRDFVTVEDKDDFLKWRRAVRELDTEDGPFAQYRIGLTRLLKKLCPEGRLEKAAQTMLWKISKEDVNETLLRIERMKTLISIALEMDHTRLSEAILTQVSSISAIAQRIKSDTRKVVSSVDEAAFRVLLDQICPEDYASVFQSNITEHTVGIGQNFIASAEFESWAGPEDVSKLLLCLGDPGVGKTVMATKAIQALYKADDTFREAVIFVYCDCTRRRSRLYRRDSSPEARSKGVQTPGHFIASLLRQLLDAHGAPSQYLRALMDRHDRQKTKLNVAELEEAFAEVAQNFDRIYVVVDAMDEVDNLELETFAAHLLSVCSSPALRLLVTSRRHPQIEQIFEDSVRLEMHAHNDDTLQYLRSRARREFAPRVLRDSKALDRILNALLLSANGIPLIARLHMNALRGVRTPGAMLAAIERLRSNSDVYDDTYQRAMERITKQEGELPAMAMKVLRWVVCAKRYLMVHELQSVLAIQENSDFLDEDFIPDLDDVFLACEGLICTVTSPGSDIVRLELVHTTARQYFDGKLAQWAPDVSLDLTRTCLNVLAFADLTTVPTSLISYAWRYWGQHAKDVEEMDEEEQFDMLVTLVRKFLVKDEPESPLSREVIIRGKQKHPQEYSLDDLQEGLTGYHLAAKFGLGRLWERLWEPSDNLDGMLGAKGYNRTPFLEAIFSQSVEMVKLMLRLRCVDPNAKDEPGMRPLHVAMALEHPDIIEALLENGMGDPNDVDADGIPLVLVAAGLGQERTVKLLLSAEGMEGEARAEFGPYLLALASLGDEIDRKRRFTRVFREAGESMATGMDGDRSLEPLPLTARLRTHLQAGTFEGLVLDTPQTAS